jgi:pimeloyl-ACP methyl ester carboxylesterase
MSLNTSAVRDRVIPTRNGGTLLIQEGGDPTGRPILRHGGTPNSRLLYEPHVALAAAQGVRLISYDRPGYGGSTPRSGRTIADCAEDVRAIADALDIDRLAVWGISGGGPHALACAALLSDRVVAVAALASPAPYDAAGLDYFEGMGQLNIDDMKLTLADPTAAREKAVKDRQTLLEATAEGVREFMKSLLTPTDAAVLTAELAEYMVRTTRDGLGPGVDGWWDDGWALLQPWGFEVEAIAMPVLVWHGRQDQFVPFQHGQWLAAHIPGVEAHLTDDDGHLTLLERRIPDVHAWLLRHFE